ncbi:MAG: hypothetical protein R3B70_14295 [Polyangiaceae bacterium]
MEVVHEVPPCSFRTALIAASLLAAAGCKGEGDDAKPSRGEEERTIVTVQS